ncbi:ORC1-type DNA replication protein [Methanogenium sp. MK-MG]|uniref:ORC1-type DNA replication protein n=1 Tax=Methanogenium sp. MK-MG TaxID=2599926 RepID=UPI0013ED0909|nr:ORC1-type DNA replication protein [Methanogenium sp. MK-MG]KAF1078040.1 ORC1-type DNA replication protein 2 [Methanogenium sp. MK-MG]
MTPVTLMDNQTLFRDISIFESGYTPDTIRYRDNQLQQLAEAVRPALLGGCPLNTVIRGPPGTGKTTCVRQIFAELEEMPRIIPVLVSCQTALTVFRVFQRIYQTVFRQQPPISGVSVASLTEAVCRELSRRNAALLICLDDANLLFHDHVLDQVLRSLLRLHEEYPGIRIGVIVIISDPRLSLYPFLSLSVVSVFRPNEVYFPPYGREEVHAILRDRVRAGLYPDVISPGVLDCIAAETVKGTNLRAGIRLLKDAVMQAENDGRTTVTRSDVAAAVQQITDLHLVSIVRTLKEDERLMLARIAALHQTRGGDMISGELFRALHKQMPMCYTLFFERLNTFRNRGLIDIYRPPNRGNTRKILLRYDAGQMRAVCETPE